MTMTSYFIYEETEIQNAQSLTTKMLKLKPVDYVSRTIILNYYIYSHLEIIFKISRHLLTIRIKLEENTSK